MAKHLDLDIQRFASGGEENYIEFFTAKGDFDQGYWDDLGWDLYKLHSVPTIEDGYLDYYGYSSMKQPHFMGWTISGQNYTVEELKTKQFNFYSVSVPDEAWAWVIDMAQYKGGLKIGNNEFTDIVLNGSSIEKVYYNGASMWNKTPAHEGKVWIEFHSPWIDVSTGGTEETAVFLIGDFCNWDTSQAILMQGRNGERKVEIPIGPGETMDFKFYIPTWGNDSWQTSTYPLNNNGYIHIEWDFNWIYLYGGNSYEAPGANDTIITDEDYQSEK